MESMMDLIKTLNALNESIKKLTKKMSTEIQTEKPIDRLEVRAKLAELSCLGFSDEVRKLLQKHGAERLSAVDDAELPTLLKEAEAIGT